MHRYAVSSLMDTAYRMSEQQRNKVDEETSYELLKDIKKKQLGKNEEAKMTIYNALPCKEYKRVFMCETAKEFWHTLIITHQGNSQVKNCKINILTQEYKKFSISNKETIDNGFIKFNAIVTSLKSLDPNYSSKNHVRKFLRALPLKWKANVITIEEAKDLAILPFDELIGNLKVYEMVLYNDGVAYKTTKEKVKPLALKAKVNGDQTSDDSDSQEESDKDGNRFGRGNQFGNRSNRFREGRGNSSGNKGGESSKPKGACYNSKIEGHFASQCRKPKENKAFMGGAWIDSEDGNGQLNDESVSCLSTLKSGCTKHMSGNRRLCTSYKAYDGGHVIVGNNLKGKVIGGGNITHDSITITNVEHVSGLAFNLISVGQLCDDDSVVSFTKGNRIGRENRFGNGANRFRKGCGNSFGNKGGESSKLKGACYNSRIEGHFASECRKPKENKAFMVGAWSDNEDGDGQRNDETCLISIDSQEAVSKPSSFNINLNIIDLQKENEKLLKSNLNGKVVGGGNITHDSITITNVEHVRGLAFNLISVGQLCDDDSVVALLRNRKPSLEYFRVFGCKVFILNTKVHLTKFDPKSYEGVFLGYSQTSKAYIVLNKETTRIEESLNVTFDKSLPEPKPSSSVEDDRIDEPIVQDLNGSLSLQVNISDEGYPKSLKEARDHPIEQVIGELNERTLRSKSKQA
uniref:Zf-CCHC domain-containing protein/DUF4219 domain-containing protein/UBN2 domain-containing protein n=1 Tax=Tanacetum cinerariifolium TaxID=118510 RepID=A0A699GXP9_TANCI|nr:zf-CCHC domain-containing protein/DUF4219 domain-containing protein/UBN2 domain-containing protein [Tanacetum cinerariifolium]